MRLSTEQEKWRVTAGTCLHHSVSIRAWWGAWWMDAWVLSEGRSIQLEQIVVMWERGPELSDRLICLSVCLYNKLKLGVKPYATYLNSCRLIHTVPELVTLGHRLRLQEDGVGRAGFSEEAASGPSAIDEWENCTYAEQHREAPLKGSSMPQRTIHSDYMYAIYSRG